MQRKQLKNEQWEQQKQQKQQQMWKEKKQEYKYVEITPQHKNSNSHMGT